MRSQQRKTAIAKQIRIYSTIMAQIGILKRPIADILADFNKPVNPKIISKKPVFKDKQKVGEVDYIHWYNLIDFLINTCPGYSWECRSQYVPDRVVVEGRLTIRAAEGDFHMEAIGVEDLDSNVYGDPCYSAEASALRRAMAKFGYALDLWRKDKKVASQSFNQQTVTQPIKTAADLDAKMITEKQVKLLYAIAKNESGLADEDVKTIIKQHGYESTKDIKQSDFDSILAQIKTAARFLTLAQRKELIEWCHAERVGNDVAKNGLESIGYKGTAQILRSEINAVKSAILQQAGKLVAN